MKRNHRLAFNALKKIGAPVYERCDIENFQISAEGLGSGAYRGYKPDEAWASYWDSCWISPMIEEVLSRYGLHAEWINAGEIGVYND
jgi:hypothetical protein